jgi:hypothetical protein
MVHRRAFRTLLGFNPLPADCGSYFAQHHVAFQRAAAEKIARAELQPDTNFHLTSRNVARALGRE